jgi:tetratricopeptide (TPR) repeat protein
MKRTTLDLNELDEIYAEIVDYMHAHMDEIADIISMLVGTMRSNGIFVSDRTASSPRYLPVLVSAWAWVSGTTIKKAGLEVAKYILQDNDEQLNAFSKAMESIYPKDLKEAFDRMSDADELLKAGNLGEAEKKAMEAINLAQGLVNKENVFELYKDEITEFSTNAMERVKKIQTLREQIKG